MASAFASLVARTWLRRVAWLAMAVLLLWGLAWLAGPPLIRHQIEKLATQALGRQVQVGRVDFRPWSLTLELQQITVAGPAGGPAQLRIARVHANAAWQSVLRFAPVVDSLEVEAPAFTLTHRGGGQYDIDDILARLAARPQEPAGGPARFALYNVRLQGGSIDFTDLPVGRTHSVRDLQLNIPFLSNLSSHREIKTEPRLAFVLNGGRFDSQAAATPFAAAGKGEARLHLEGFDLAPYLRYLPPGLPVQPQSALLDADLRVDFVQAPRPVVKIAGTLQLRQVRVATGMGRELLALDAMAIELAEVRPLERSARLASVTLAGPRLLLARDREGQLNLVAPRASAAPAPPPVAVPAQGTSAAAPMPTEAGWEVALDRLTLRDGQVGWADETLAPAVRAQAREINLDATTLAWPMAREVQFKAAMVLDAPTFRSKGTAVALAAPLRLEGSAGLQAASVAANLSGLPLEAASPYLSQWFVPTLGGSLSADLRLDWKAAEQASQPAQAQIRLTQVTVGKPVLTQGTTSWLAVERLQAQDGLVDLVGRTVSIGQLRLVQPRMRLERAADGRWMFANWAKDSGAAAPAGAAGVAAPWAIMLRDATVEGGTVAYRDLSTPRPVALDLTSVRLQARNLSPESRLAAPVTLSARVGAGPAEPGSFLWRGSVNLGQPAAQGELQFQQLPLHALEPYFAHKLNVELLRADASFTGRLDYAAAGSRLRLQGDAAIEDLRANTLAPGGLAGEELLSWKALSLRGVDVAMADANTSMAVQETVLSDFFSRLIVQENGRINLQDLLRHEAQPAATLPATAASATAGASATATALAAAAPPASAAQAAAPSDLHIRFGPVSLINGRVDFSDRFVRPNYSARLSELTGRLSAFSSESLQGAPQLADLELRGRAEGTAALEITGKLNPLAKPLALDIKGKVRDLELPPLSPYSVKYAGHGIERGKLSLDVNYQVQPDGRLTASNKLVLNQLVFGDKVEGAPASLPVKLAVALLADRNGVIDLDLPVSGSLNDPQFSLGPVIFKLIVNLVVKAIASPFTLLASALGGGGDELSMVGFAPGSAQLGAEARAGLDKVAKALADRPALRMTVVGTASLEAEREAYRRERLQALLIAEKRRSALRAGGALAGAAPSAPAAAASTAAPAQERPAGEDALLSPAEYAALLREVYRRGDFPKPRNLVGLAKDLAPAEMEALLLAQIPVTEERVRELAVARGVAVRDYLASRQLAPERLFLGAAKAVAPESKWSPRAELQLASP